MTRPRVLVIDDSAFARTVLTKLMQASGLIEVVGTATDGLEGLVRIGELDPDVVTLDLTMPGIDGIGLLRALQGRSRPRVIVVSTSTIDTDLGAEALLLGAIDLISKPTVLADERLQEIGTELVAKVVAAAESYRVRPSLPSVRGSRSAKRVALIMIGTSTGGPQALTQLLAALPATLAVPIAIVLHIPAGYTEALANRLDVGSSLTVVEAKDGMPLQAGVAVIARGGQHLFIERDGLVLRARLSALPGCAYTPSVDELFSSGATAVAAGALGIVLTGMGDDGLAGARAIAAAGGALLTQSAASCVVYGMPRCVDEAAIGAMSLSIEDMAEEILRRV